VRILKVTLAIINQASTKNMVALRLTSHFGRFLPLGIAYIPYSPEHKQQEMPKVVPNRDHMSHEPCHFHEDFFSLKCSVSIKLNYCWPNKRHNSLIAKFSPFTGLELEILEKVSVKSLEPTYVDIKVLNSARCSSKTIRLED